MLRLLPILISVSSLLAASSSHAYTYDDGLSHLIDIDNSFYFERLTLDDGPGGNPTELTIVDHGIILEDLLARSNSRVQMLGGAVRTMRMEGSSFAAISGGEIGLLQPLESGTHVTISGGRMGIAAADGQVDVSGGDLSFISLSGAASGTVTVTGGLIRGGIGLNGLGNLTITGGEVRGQVALNQHNTGRILGGLFTQGSLTQLFSEGELTIFGTDFNFPLGDLVPLAGTLTGILSNGDPLNVSFGRSVAGRITLVELLPIPEPSTAALVGSRLGPFSITHRQQARKARGRISRIGHREVQDCSVISRGRDIQCNR